jgi:putative SOS response-associated peptidase YedK
VCGRFFRHSPRDETAETFGAAIGNILGDHDGSYNIAPTHRVLTVRFNAKSEQRTLDDLHWGLVPHFANDKKIAWKTINARAETLAKAPAYRSAFAKRRCLVVADGFYEWKAVGKRKQPFAIAMKSREPFGLAGLWENWQDPATGEWLRSCTIVTTRANELVGHIHDRMPVILKPEDYPRWLGEEPASPEELLALLKPYEASAMVMWPVSPVINRPGVADDPSVLEPVVPPDLPPPEGGPNSA